MTMISSKLTKTLVMKFGGTSVGSISALVNVVDIVKSARKRFKHVIVVTSAFSKVTNQLLDCATAAAQGDILQLDKTGDELLHRHIQAIDAFSQGYNDAKIQKDYIEGVIRQFTQLVSAISAIGESSPRALDAVASLGEKLSVCVLSSILNASDIPSVAINATKLVRTNDQFQNAVPNIPTTRAQSRKTLMPHLEQGVTPVITGFIGEADCGAVTTLGRGGSDYSASLIAALLPADEVWIWTDVDGVMTADPRVVPEAQTIPIISYQEVAELAYYGAKVLHPKSIRPVIEAGIPLRVLNTFNPNGTGTLLTNEKLHTNGSTIKAVTAFRGMQLITVEGRGMLGVPGVAARIFSAVATTGATVPLITEASSEQSLTFAVPAEIAPQVLNTLNTELSGEISNRNIDQIWATDEVAIITVVSPAMRTRLGVAGRVFSILGEEKINVLAISHGSSDVSISLVVAIEDCYRTVTALHPLTSS